LLLHRVKSAGGLQTAIEHDIIAAGLLNWSGKMRKLAKFVISFSLIALLLAACGQTASLAPTTSPDQNFADNAARTEPFAQFKDIPIPGGAKMDMERTIILGAQNAWTGRVYLQVKMSANKLFEFYKLEMSKFGWRQLTSVRATISVLTYERGSRIATVQILAKKLQGTIVIITMSPKGSEP